MRSEASVTARRAVVSSWSYVGDVDIFWFFGSCELGGLWRLNVCFRKCVTLGRAR